MFCRSAEDATIVPSKSQSLNITRHNSYQFGTSPGGQTETFSFGLRKTSASFKSSDHLRQLHNSNSDSEVPTDITCGCDPSLFCKVKLPSLCGEGTVCMIYACVVTIASFSVSPEKFYDSLISLISNVIKVCVCACVCVCMHTRSCVSVSASVSIVCVYVCTIVSCVSVCVCMCVVLDFTIQKFISMMPLGEHRYYRLDGTCSLSQGLSFHSSWISS